MSPKRQTKIPANPDGKVWVRGFAVRFTQGMALPDHDHDWHQLSYAAHGVLKVTTEGGHWVIPPHRAAWIPAGTQHREDMRGQGALRNLYFARAACRGMPRDCASLDVSPLLRELIVHSAEQGAMDVRTPANLHLVKVLLQQLRSVARLDAHQLPMPRDGRALSIARQLWDEPANETDLESWARRVGASKRTIQRAFLNDTRISFARWRQRARLLAAVERLAAGTSVTDTALDVGYSSVSAFVSSFRREFGVSPGRFIEG